MGNMYKTALDLQDACNPQGVTKEIARLCDQIADELRGESGFAGTDEIRRHPVFTLVVDKLYDMAGRPDTFAYGKAYDVCKERAEGGVK